jgi:hypothetical protein
MDLISNLREPKLHLGEGLDVAYFDFLSTIAGGYMVAKYMDWNKPATIGGMFVVGHIAHNMTGTITTLTAKINRTLVPINNSTAPVKLNETRVSTF